MRSYILRKRAGFSLIGAALFLGGCGTTPMNADEFRRAMKSGAPTFTTVESYEVARPFQDVSATLRKKSGECLAVAVNWTVRSNMGSRSGVRTWKPTFVADSKRAELHIQRKRQGGGEIDLGGPPDGFYRLVLDATPVGKGRTKIDLYSQTGDDKLIRQALRGWVQGDNLGCPDLTKVL
jgi:hypothetical protein